MKIRNIVIKRRSFGHSGKQISEISFGCGGFWGLPIFSEKKAEELLKTCLDHGVNFLDTGPNYSSGNAELRLGKILKGKYQGLMLATKAGSRLMSNGKVKRDFSPNGIEDSLISSLKRLRTDHVDLLQLHGPSVDVINSNDVLNKLENLRKRGLIYYIGVSCDEKVAEKVAGMSCFDSLMITYNIVTQNSWSTIKQAFENGQAVLIKSPLAHHVFSNELFKLNSISKIWYLLRILKSYKKNLWIGKKYKYINKIEGWTGTEVALKFVLHNPYVSSVVIGTTNIHHLIENLAVSSKKYLSKELARKIETTI
jgi:aryl-alcohol dehydrogenase-like predicted oxidoreductase